MSNVIAFAPRQAKAKDKPIEKAAQLATGPAPEDLVVEYGLYKWMLGEYVGFLEEAERATGLGTELDSLSHELSAPAPETVRFELFARLSRSNVFLTIEETKLEAVMEESSTRTDLCIAKLGDFLSVWQKKVGTQHITSLGVAPMLFIGFLRASGAHISHYRMPMSYDRKIVVVMQNPKLSAEYRMEVDYNALLEPEQTA